MVTIENELKKELTKAVENFKDSLPNEFKDWFIEKYGCIPDEFILNENDIITRFVNLPIEQYLNIAHLSFFTKQYIRKTDITPNTKILKIYSIDELEELYIGNNPLIEKIKKSEVEKLNNELELNGKNGLLLGYKMLSFLSGESVYYYLNKNPNSRDALHIKHADILEGDPESRKYLENSLKSISILTNKHYKYISPSEIHGQAWETIKNEKIFTEDITNNIIIASKENINFPYFIARDLVDDFRSKEKKHGNNIDRNKEYDTVLLKKEAQVYNPVIEYVQKNPENIMELLIDNTRLEKTLVEFTQKQSPAIREVGNFLIKNGYENYIKKTTGKLEIKEIHNDSNLNLRTIKRFTKDYYIYIRENHPDLNPF